MLMNNHWLLNPVASINQSIYQQAVEHQQQLTKPPGSLGDLELVAQQFAAWQERLYPAIDMISVVVFAADHGVCAQNISAFPQVVTAQMIANFLSGGAAISVLSRSYNADFSVVNLGTVGCLPEHYKNHSQLRSMMIARSTQDFSCDEAMTQKQLYQALDAGKQIVDGLTAQLFIGGEMGIGNTTSASAIYAALLNLEASAVVGIGTGIDDAGIARKIHVVNTALDRHCSRQPEDILRSMGGFEIAALVGSYIACAQKGIPIIVDGFICTAAALLAVAINSGVRDWLLFSHCSAEPAHALALQKLNAKPLLDLGLRLGEGSGAALAVPLIQSALLLHRQMATFQQAGVSHD